VAPRQDQLQPGRADPSPLPRAQRAAAGAAAWRRPDPRWESAERPLAWISPNILCRPPAPALPPVILELEGVLRRGRSASSHHSRLDRIPLD
jgi:hypothetical protein